MLKNEFYQKRLLKLSDKPMVHVYTQIFVHFVYSVYEIWHVTITKSRFGDAYNARYTRGNSHGIFYTLTISLSLSLSPTDNIM